MDESKSWNWIPRWLVSGLVVTFVGLWCAWVSTTLVDTIIFMREGNRFTASEAYEMERRINQRINSLPPPLWQKRIDDMCDRIDKLEEKEHKHAI